MLAGELAHRFGIVAGASEDPHIMINGVPRDMSAVESVNGRKMFLTSPLMEQVIL
jgi:hypothetical protein